MWTQAWGSADEGKGVASLRSEKTQKWWHLCQALKAEEDLNIGEEEHGTHFRQGTAQTRLVGLRAWMDSRANE